MGLGKLRIAVATKGDGGLDDVVSEVFGRANTFTIVDVDGNEIKGVEALQNPALSYEHGVGPIVVKMLVDSGVNMVVVPDVGLGASELLEQHNIATVTVKPGSGVTESVKNALTKVEK